MALSADKSLPPADVSSLVDLSPPVQSSSLPAIQSSPLSPVRVNILTAAKARWRLLREVVCSEYWMSQIVVPAGDPAGATADVPAGVPIDIPADGRNGRGDVWLIRQDVYPPAGDNVRMRVCPVCDRICPPGEVVGGPCCDCRAEHDAGKVLRLVAEPDNCGLEDDLMKLSRMATVSYTRFKRTNNLGTLGMSVEEDLGEGSQREVPDEGTGSDNVTPLGNRRPRRRLACEYELFSIVQKFLSKRAGCSASLLPEAESDLLEEIAYFAENGTIMPRASKAFFRISRRK